MPIVVMGVSGSGKSTIGSALADHLGLRFVDGDELHPEKNVLKMAAGIPLGDADRLPWLSAICRELASDVVVACSALKRVYRDQMRATNAHIQFIYLSSDAETLDVRMALRISHFMPASLLASQLDVLEPPDPDEHAFEIDATQAPAEVIAQALQAIRGRPGAASISPHFPTPESGEI